MADDSVALAAITARTLAEGLQAAATRLPIPATLALTTHRIVYTVSALLAPAIATAPDVAAIGGSLASAASSLRTASEPIDAAPVCYEAAARAAAAVPTFASPGRQRSASLARVLAGCIEASWLGEAFVAEAQTAFGDRQAATAARRRIAAAMDGALDRIAAASVGQGVIDILGSVARTASDHIANLSANLRPIIRAQTPRSAPSTAIAFELYGDPSRATELVARANCGTPLFMPTSFDALAPDA